MEIWKELAPLPSEMLNLNIDGAFLVRSKTDGCGFIYSSWSCGKGLLAGAGRLYVVHDATCAEAESCRVALQAALLRGISHVQLETDSSILVTALDSLR